MATITARGAASVSALGDRNVDTKFNTSTPAGWHMIFWGSSVLLIAFFLWAL